VNPPRPLHSQPQRPLASDLFHLSGGGTHITVSAHGASWLSCELDAPSGQAAGQGTDRREVMLGYHKQDDYGSQPGYLGAVVGRYANRIAHARFTGPKGDTHVLTPNEGGTQLHGGPDGFDKRDWQVLSCDTRTLVLGLSSPAGDQGFPGHLQAQVAYAVDEDGAVTLRFDTWVDQPCPVNLSSHGYFNLDGANAMGDTGDVLDHRLHMAARHYLPIDAHLIPTGELAPVQGTPFDFSQDTPLRSALMQAHPQLSLGGGGLDHCFVLDETCIKGDAPALRLGSADGRLTMQIFTTYPGLQCYTGNYLTGIPGRNSRPMQRHGGIAMEPEYFPDSPNHPEWPQPSCWQQPGEQRSHFIRYTFDWTA
jgi:aldose 1-epimerase